MIRRRLTHPDGRLRMGRLVPVIGICLVMAMFGTILVVVTPRITDSTMWRTLFVLFVLFGMKFPLVGILWWLIGRNREWPGQPVRWDPEEAAEILRYLEQQSDLAMVQPDAAARLTYLSAEAWNVADHVADDAKVDALTVALRIDERRSRVGAAGGPDA